MLLLSLLMAVSASAADYFSGVVDSYTREGETLVVNGSQYRVTGDTVILFDGHVVTRNFLREGMFIKYSLDFNQAGARRFVTRIVLPENDEVSRKMMQH